MSNAAALDLSASCLISDATVEKPFPFSPARAASTAALMARKSVRLAMSLIILILSMTVLVLSNVCADALATLPMSVAIDIEFLRANSALLAVSDIDDDICSTVVEISSTDTAWSPMLCRMCSAEVLSS